ncbi:MAG: ATP-binding cassette domain-containing protein, partial [Nitrososphaeria archaeon]|nr:ATP-binding cassette domain-containing protein [Nitrososphaeria archaeon]
MNQELLNVRDLKTYFYSLEGVVKAVDGVDLKLRKGETIGLVGETGCGKSVTSLSIMKLVPRPGQIIG